MREQLSQAAPDTGLMARPAYALTKLSQVLSDRLEQELATAGLSLRTHQVLACVSEHAGGSQQMVSNSIEVDRSEMVRIVDRLEEAGMLRRGPDPDDRRRHRLQLTPAGQRVLRRGEAIVERITTKALSRLSGSERETLHALALRALGEDLPG